MNNFDNRVNEYSKSVDTGKIASLIAGGSGIGLGAYLGTIFDQAGIEEEAFQKVIEAIESTGDNPVIDGYNIPSIFGNPQNLIDVWNPDAGFIEKYDFSSVLEPYAAGLTTVMAGNAIAGALLGLGLYTLIKNKKASSALLGGSAGAAAYSAIMASNYANALSEMPFQIGGTNLADYCTENPQFAEEFQPLIDGLMSQYNTSKTVAIGIAAVAGAAFVYSALKKAPKVSDYNTDLLE